MRHLFVLLLLSFPIVGQAQLLKDPTMPPGYQAPQVQKVITSTETGLVKEWVLNTTLVSPHQKIAMINGKRVVVGDSIGGAEVMEIDHQEVILRIDGKLITVNLNNAFISSIQSKN